MGLCKCPSKRVSSLFCYDHRVTVCENCLALNHRKCVIKSYLEWLKDSDFDPTCSLCGVNLEDDDCIRLVCYDLFHKKCLSERQAQLPPNTAAAGHQCPKCGTCIFPPPNMVSPVVDALRVWLSQVSWGKNELSMTLDEKNFPVFEKNDTSSGLNNSNSTSVISGNSSNVNSIQQHHRNVSEKVFKAESPHSVLNIESRPLLREPPVGRSIDRDDNKYKRRTPQEIFSRWSRQFNSPASRSPFRRRSFLIAGGFLLFVFIIFLMYHFGRSGDDDDFSDVHYE